MADTIRIKNLIDGEWVIEANEKTLPLYNPSTGEQIGEVPVASQTSVEAAVKSSHEAYLKWRKMPIGGIKDSLVGNNKVQGKDGFDFFTQNKVSTIRVAPPQSLSAEQSAGGGQNGDEFASKGNVRSCIAS